MVQMDSVYLYIFSTSRDLGPKDKVRLTDTLTRSLATFFQRPHRSPYNLPELLGKIYEDRATGNCTVKVTPSSSVPFIVSDRSSNFRFADLQPEASFPLQPLKPSIFGPGLTTPPPAATEGVEALWVQLTFLNGGFVIHVHIHHWIAGVASAGRLVEAWFERARLLASLMTSDSKTDEMGLMDDIVSSSTIRLVGRETLADSLNSVTVPQLEHPHLLHVPGGRRVFAGLDLHPFLLWLLVGVLKFMLTYLAFILPQSEVQIFHFKPGALKTLRTDVQSGTVAENSSNTKGDMSNNNGELTANGCLTALIWSCITRARFSTSDEHNNVPIPNNQPVSTANSQTSTILTAVDYKSRLDPPIDPNFFGNASLDVHTTLPVSNLISTSANTTTTSSSSPSSSSSSSSSPYLTSIARSIHRNISSTTSSQIRSMYQLIASRPRILDTRQRPLRFQYGSDVLCTSWEHVHKDPELLKLDNLLTGIDVDGTSTEKGKGLNRIRFETMRYMHVEGVDGVVVVLPAYGRKWTNEKEKRSRDDGGDGAAARQCGLEAAISLRRDAMRKLKSDEIFARYAEWGEEGGY